MTHCPECGKSLAPRAKFCAGCGRAVIARDILSQTRINRWILLVPMLTILMILAGGAGYWLFSDAGDAVAAADIELVTTDTTDGPTVTIDAGPATLSAKISRDEAVFVFPMQAGKIYEWCSGGLLWGNEVKVNDRHELGFALMMPMVYNDCHNGDLDSLINAGQLNIWRKQSDGTGTDSGIPIAGATSENGDRMTILVKGKKNIATLFGHRPEKLKFVITTPDGERQENVRVVYAANFGQNDAAPKLATAPKLTKIDGPYTGSSCSIALDRKMSFVFAGMDYESLGRWDVGIEGTTHSFQDNENDPSQMMTADGRRRITVKNVRTLEENSVDPSQPSILQRVKLTLEQGDRNFEYSAYQYCSDH